MSKPYIEKQDSAGRFENELATQYWCNFLHRNWSFIAFLFFGQMRAYLKCNECSKERISFDEFSTLSLPLPESSLINFNIVIQVLPMELKKILVPELLIEDPLSLLESQELEQARKVTLNFEVYKQNVQVYTKERPLILPISMTPST